MKIEAQIVSLRDIIKSLRADIAKRQEEIYISAEMCSNYERQLKELEALAGCVVMPESQVEN